MSQISKLRGLACGVACLALLVAMPACGGKGDKAKTGDKSANKVAKKAAPKVNAEARAKFDTLCWTCHGKTGAGDGPAAAALNPKPRAFGDAEWQKSVTDEHIKKTILEGGAAVGKSPVMAANSDLKGKDAVLDGLVKIIRDFAKK